MIKKLLLLLVACMALTVQVKATEPFRRHRENAFSAISNAERSIIFIGNSITHMNEWRESFGVPEDVSILNRGISGAVSDEVINNLESYIANKPSKIFIMLGTNDLATAGIMYPEYPLNNLKKIITRIRKETPSTKIYVQSILPSSVGARSYNVPLTNPLYKAYVDSLKDENVKFIDLYTPLSQNGTNNMKDGTSLDALHPNAAGYAIWTRTIAEQVGYAPVYPDNLQSIANGDASYGGNPRAWGMRISNFYRFPVEKDNILLIGDEMIAGGELHEFLRNGKVLSHGTGWGYGSGSISQINEGAKASLGINSYIKAGLKRESPKQIYLYVGATDMAGNTTVENAIEQYKNLVNTCKQKAPESKIFIMTLLNTATTAAEIQKFKDFNARLSSIAKETEGVELVDLYSALNNADGSRVAEYFCNPEGGHYYVSGLGYARIAEVLAENIGEGCNPITVNEARGIKALNDARNALGVVISKALDVKFDGTAGSYNEEVEASLGKALEAAYAELAKGNKATVETLNSQVAAINAALAGIAGKIVQPQYSNDTKTVTYAMKSVRLNKAITNNGAGRDVTGGAYGNNPRQMWKFVQRDDQSLDIISLADGAYLNPASNIDSPLKTSATRPSTGWTLKGCDKAGAFIITSGTAQVNQSNQDNVLNWGGGGNTNDVGCQYLIEEVEMQQANWYRIKYENNAAFGTYYKADALKGRYIHNRVAEYKQQLSGSNVSYPLGVATDATAPKADDAAYFVNIMPASQDGYKYVQSANGHYLASNATASLTATALPFAYDGEKVNVGQSFILFPNLDNIWGYTSNAGHASATRYTLEKVNLTEVGLTAWTVNVMNGTTASQIVDNTQVSCSNPELKGINKVYDQGTFFFPAEATPQAGDFGVEGYLSTVTVNEKDKTVSVVVGDRAITADEAKAILANKGVGYPAEDAASRKALEQAIEAGNSNALLKAVEAFKADTNVELPKSGKAYYIINTQANGTKRYFNNTTGGLQLVQTTATDNLPESALFVVREEGGKFVLVNTLGQFLIFKGSTDGANGNKGYVETYDRVQCDLSIKRFSVADGNNASIKAGTTDADLFGRLFITGKRKNGTDAVCFVMKSDGNFDQAPLPFYNDNFSSAVQLVEADDWHNAVDWTVEDGDSLLGTLCLPFAVEKGSVNAFGVELVENGTKLEKREIAGGVIPANTPVLVTSANKEVSPLIPAITAGEAPVGNDLVAAAGNFAYTIGQYAGKLAFIPLTGGAEAGRAYLSFDEKPSVEAFPFADVSTGIGSANTAVSSNGDVIFDLFGRRVSKPVNRGIYVIGGKKVIVK